MAPVSSKTDKPKDTGGAMRRLLVYIFEYKISLIAAIILAVSGNILALAGPAVSGKAIDVIGLGSGRVDFEKVFFYVAILVCIYILAGIMTYSLSVIMIRLGRNVSKKMRQEVFDKLTKLPVGYFDTHQTGDIISRVSYDIDVVNTSVSADITQVITSIITVAGSFGMMLFISRKLVLVVLVTLPASVIYTKYMTGKTRPLFRRRSKKYGELNGYTEEMFSGQKTIQAYAKEKNIISKFDVINTSAADAYYEADYYGAIIGPSVGFINNISLALVAIAGSVLYLNNMTGIGQISSFILYSRKFSGPVNEIANMYNEILSALAAAERVFNFLDEEEEVTDKGDAVSLGEVKGQVEFKNVNFGYNKSKIIIEDFNLRVRPGQVVAIVGPTGAGKTTLINLLMRFYDVCGGQVLLDGIDIRDIKRDELRKSFTMVLQDTWLFGGTIAENIAYGNPEASRGDIERAAKSARISFYVNNLRDKYDTVITEDAGNLSKGQKQLMTIARAMLVDSKILILDEATSNVDTHTEKQIQKAMLALMKDKTCFIIAHRLSTIENADIILVIKDGTVMEQGSHRTLMEKKGEYYNMYMAQYN
ncbi:MAG: ABC transporter ATP-binding protein [Lachnospiraceae bacterium]|nr:ABC transporter ATP-binding protein [Lachnospiraceae bacterium]